MCILQLKFLRVRTKANHLQNSQNCIGTGCAICYFFFYLKEKKHFFREYFNSVCTNVHKKKLPFFFSKFFSRIFRSNFPRFSGLLTRNKSKSVGKLSENSRKNFCEKKMAIFFRHIGASGIKKFSKKMFFFQIEKKVTNGAPCIYRFNLWLNYSVISSVNGRRASSIIQKYFLFAELFPWSFTY